MLGIYFVLFGAFVISLDMGLHRTIQEADKTPTEELGNNLCESLSGMATGSLSLSSPHSPLPMQSPLRKD